ncbi:hypothetical protein MAR_032976 [Mya arenaria]|uniref:Uncharacterized protein n=1 Tax=Mya arenaria TaxID=6604 RepID=A0ABY7GA51_MYAAR|nr:hypothetical protein MAR_032976 [Mya arenaria]
MSEQGTTTQLCKLQHRERDNYNNIFPKDAGVIRSHYYAKSGPASFKLIPKKTALISSNSVMCFLQDVKAKKTL